MLTHHLVFCQTVSIFPGCLMLGAAAGDRSWGFCLLITDLEMVTQAV